MSDYNFKQSTSAKCPTILEATMRWNRKDAMSFDGGDVMASADLGKILGGKQASTVMMVVEGGVQTEAYPYILRAKNDDSAFDIYCKAGSSGYIRVRQYDSNGDTIGQCTKSIANIEGNKLIICIVNEGAGGSAYLYVDNASNPDEDATFNSSNYDVDLVSAVTFFGGLDSGPSSPFTGNIPTIAFYDYALSDAQVSEAMTAMRDEYCVQGWGYDGTNSYTTGTASTDMQLQDGDWSVAIRFKLNSHGTDHSYLFSIGAAGANHSLHCYVIESDDGVNGGKVRVRIEDGDGHDTQLFSDSVDDTDWHSLILSRDGADFNLYVDDPTTPATTTVGIIDAIAFTSSLILGFDRNSGGYLDGTLKDFGIFKTYAMDAVDRANYMGGDYLADTPGDSPEYNIVMTSAEAETTGGFAVVGTGHTVTHSDDGAGTPTSYVTPEYK
ncbi:MAG: hypothetical protein GY841_02750 [FCB group bacterium]|nr:hypothetical protein [FCB group bacterium]